jgi:hypothetical protein
MSNNQNSFNTIISSIGALVSRIDTLTSRVDTLTSRVDTLTSSVDNIKLYIHNESIIQEKRNVHAIRDYIHDSGTYNIEISPIRNFYLHTSNNIFNNFDGCLLVRSPVSTTRVRNLSDVNHNINLDCTYIIETKHCFTKHLIDYKLDQFCTIIDTFQKLHNGTIRVPNTPRTNFDHIVHNYDLRNFPKNILFVFASDDIDTRDVEYILSINSGSLTEDVYNEYLVYTFKNHKTYKEILDDNEIGGIVKRQLREINTIDDIILICSRENTGGSLSRQEQALDAQKQLFINKYGESIIDMLVPFTSMNTCYNLLKDHLRVFTHGKMLSE